VRQKDGSVAAFLNQCRHRGMRICRADGGNTKAFMCSYHGWTYDIAGNLISVPHESDGYRDELDKSSWGPLKVPRIEKYQGMIFGNWDAKAPSFEEYLGHMKWYMDGYFDRVEGGSEVIGGMHRWVLQCNWKFAAEQFCSDMYHAELSHASAMMVQNIGAGPEGNAMPLAGRQFSADNGHGTGFFTRAFSPQGNNYFHGPVAAEYYNGPALEQARQRVGEPRATGVFGGHMTVFPTFSFLPGIQTLRVWHPRGPGEIEVWAWALVDKAAPLEVKEAVRLGVMRTFSMGGMWEQDDGENWLEIQKVLRGYKARNQPLNIQMGLGHSSTEDPLFPGKTNHVFGEEAARGFYKRWADLMGTPNPEQAR
jgi:phenylpropionate dioxygenase-like ring-hydroxylating dioxygenase large terminal subunit